VTGVAMEQTGSGSSVFTPEMFVNNFLSQKNISKQETGISSVVVLSWTAGVIHWFGSKTKAKKIKSWIFSNTYPVYQAEINNKKVTFIQVGMGAPATVASMEEMIVCGAEVFIGLGWTGSLRKEIKTGDALIPVECVVEEGTSPHYVQDASLIKPDKDIANIIKKAGKKNGLNITPNIQWTTDAPYRELRSKVYDYGNKGVSGVDMETSAMYALGVFRKVSVCNLLVVSDELWDTWNPNFYSAILKESFEKAQDTVLGAVEEILSVKN